MKYHVALVHEGSNPVVMIKCHHDSRREADLALLDLMADPSSEITWAPSGYWRPAVLLDTTGIDYGEEARKCLR